MAKSSRWSVLILVATVMMLMWSFKPEPMEVDKDGNYMLGLRVPVPPIIRAVNTVGSLMPKPVWRLLLPLDFQSLKSRAKVLTGGLEDLGEFWDMEAFQMLLTNVDENSHFIGRINWWLKLPAMLGTHLRITKILQDHPEILSQKIEQPIIIAGYTRSGSTWLHHILTETYGDNLRYVKFWESLGGGIEFDPQHPGGVMKHAEDTLSAMHMFPSIFAMHEVHGVNEPEEEIGWTELTFRGLLTAMQIQHPHLDHLAVDPSSARLRNRLLKTIMQIKQWEGGPQRWVFKNSEHLTGVHELTETFPDAKVVTIHRDEVSVYKSLLMLFHTTRSITFSDVDVEKTKSATDVQVCGQRRGLAAVPNLGLNSLALNFHDVIQKPIETLEKVVEFAGLEWNATSRARTEAAVQAAAARKKSMGGKITYDIKAFGLTDESIRERLVACDQQEKHYKTSTSQTERITIRDNVICMTLGANETNQSIVSDCVPLKIHENLYHSGYGDHNSDTNMAMM